jgi:hypothetical protein
VAEATGLPTKLFLGSPLAFARAIDLKDIKMDRKELADRLVERISSILKRLGIEFITGQSDNRYNVHLSFKISEKRAFMFVQYENRVRPEDRSNLHFKFAKDDNPVEWREDWRRQGKENRWIEKFEEVWGEDYQDQGRPDAIYSSPQHSLYGIQVGIEDLEDENFENSIIPFIKAAYAQATKDKEQYDSIRNGLF